MGKIVRIALATCSVLPEFEVDDRALVTALEQRGAAVEQPRWNDASVDWSQFDACLIRTTWDYQLHRDAFVAWAHATARVTRFFNPPAVIAWNTAKTYLRELESAGFPIIPTTWLSQGDDLEGALAALGARASRGFLKPVVGANSQGTLRFSLDGAGRGAALAHLAAELPQGDYMLQPYWDTVESQGEMSVFVLDGQVTHGVVKRPAPGDYKVQDDQGGTDSFYAPTTEEAHLGRRMMAAASRGRTDARDEGLLYGRADFLRSPQGEWHITELELVEPSLFFRHAPKAAQVLADGLLRRL